ncbi:MAG: arsenate reductase (glutaredoxin) [Neisseria sp.]|nr:arsenate reductase (glutaredoxin) [Neisseria sp.]
METLILYHNPRCSKSRAAAEYLKESGIPFRSVDYLAAPPDVGELREICRKLGLSDPRGMMRRREEPYARLGLDGDDVAAETLLAAIAAHPILLERPIAVYGDKAAIGRPLDNIAALLDGQAA